jgi:putative flippase GtrA
MIGNQLAKFLITGLISTFLNFSSYYLILLLEINYLIAATIGYFVGVMVGFILNNFWSFKKHSISKRTINNKIVRYLLVYIFSLISGLILLEILIGYLSFYEVSAYVIMIAITTATNYIGLKFLVFNK